MSDFVTKDHFDGAIATLRGDIREVVSHFNQSQGEQNKRLDGLESDMKVVKTDLSELKDDMGKVKLAVLDYLGTDRHLRNLVHILQRLDLPVKESEVFS